MLSTCNHSYSSQCAWAEKHKQSFAGAQGCPPVTTGDNSQSLKHTCTRTPECTYTFIYLSNTKHEAEQKLLSPNVSVQFPLLSLLILFFLPVPLSPSRLFLHLPLCSPIPLAPPLSLLHLSVLSLVLYFRVGLPQSYYVECVCDSSHTRHT